MNRSQHSALNNIYRCVQGRVKGETMTDVLGPDSTISGPRYNRETLIVIPVSRNFSGYENNSCFRHPEGVQIWNKIAVSQLWGNFSTTWQCQTKRRVTEYHSPGPFLHKPLVLFFSRSRAYDWVNLSDPVGKFHAFGKNYRQVGWSPLHVWSVCIYM